MSSHQKPGFPPLPQASSQEDTQPVERPNFPNSPPHATPGQFVTGGFAPVQSAFDPPQADDAPTIPPEHMAQIQGAPPHLPSEPGRMMTGQLDAITPQHDPFMTGRMNAVTQRPPNQHLLDAFSEEPDRVSYGIWGAAVGCIVGIIFGVLNALFEGVYPSDNQGPLIIFTLLGLVIGGAVSAAAPRRVSKLIKDLFYFYR